MLVLGRGRPGVEGGRGRGVQVQALDVVRELHVRLDELAASGHARIGLFLVSQHRTVLFHTAINTTSIAFPAAFPGLAADRQLDLVWVGLTALTAAACLALSPRLRRAPPVSPALAA